MMRGLAESLENHHRVRILAEAVEDAVKLSHRYISGRQLPDKSVSVLDTACARVAIGQGATPASVEDAQRRIDQLTTEISALEREAVTGLPHDERIAELTAAKISEEERLSKLKAQWDRERKIIEQIRNIRGQLEQHALARTTTPNGKAPAPLLSTPAPAVAGGITGGEATATAAAPASSQPTSETQPEVNVAALKEQLSKLNEELDQVQGETPLM